MVKPRPLNDNLYVREAATKKKTFFNGRAIKAISPPFSSLMAVGPFF